MSSTRKNALILVAILILATVLGNYLGTYLGRLYESAACYREPVERLGAAYSSVQNNFVVSDGCVGIVGPTRILIYFVTIASLNILTVAGYFLIKKFWRKK